MFTKTTIAIALILALVSGASAVEKRQHNGSPYGSQQLGGCAHGTWDAYGLRCDSAS